MAATTLRMRDLRSDTQRTWGRFNALDEEIDSGLFLWEEQLFHRFVHPGDRVLVIGCGTGRDLVALGARGHPVTGVEPAAPAAALARAAVVRRGVVAEVVQGYFEDVALSDVFDTIVFSYFCYGYIPESRRRIDVLRKAKARLAPGGTILISYVGNLRRRPSRLLALMQRGTRVLRSDWHPEPGDIVQPMLAGEPRFHYEHIFTPGEVDAETAAAGLRLIFHDESTFDPWVVALSV
jgi:SAM-dependent methyltransferase